MLAGPNVCVMGPAGVGKTHSLGTLADAGIEVFYLGLENGLESLLGYWTDRGLPVPENVHWHVIEASKAGLKELQAMAEKINMLSYKNLTEYSDPNRQSHNSLIKVYECLNNFVDQRTGECFGPVDEWGPDRALCMDGLTGLNNAAMALVVGARPTRGLPDWGVAQTQVENLIRMLADGCKCWFVLLAHVEREKDEILGGVKLMISTLGQKLAPKLPSIFSDVILAVRNGDKWSWDTASSMADVKTRNLTVKGDLRPDFRPIVEKWRTRAKSAE